MEKSAVDSIITEYVPRIYGFALSKTGDSREAEELASDITYEVYLSLLRAEEIYHVNSYIWRISSYVYARYADRRRKGRERGEISIDGMEAMIRDTGGRWPEALTDTDDPATLAGREDERAAHADDLRRMRREIAYLGDTQRKIIVAHYLHGQTVAAIAHTLDIPAGTVKWHLYDARKTIQEGMKMKRSKGQLGYEPIQLEGLGHGGSPGTTGDTSTHLATRLAQNIAYAAYDEPKTEAEIAEELGLSPLYLAEFIQDLEEYAFLTRLPNGKLRTDVVIDRPTKASTEAIHRERMRAAQRIADDYLEQMMANIDAYMEAHGDALYIPDHDRNLWRWTAFMIGWFQQNQSVDEKTQADLGAFHYERPDGGCFTAFASLATSFDVDFDQRRYFVCGVMTRSSDLYGGIHSTQIRTNYDSRNGYWAENLGEDYVTLYECYTGQLPETEPNADKYRRLFERGLLVRREGAPSVNVIVRKAGTPELDLFAGINMDSFNEMLRDVGATIGEMKVPLYAPHMKDYIRACNLAHPHTQLFMYLYEQLLDRGYLTVPADDRRGGITTLVTAEALPK